LLAFGGSRGARHLNEALVDLYPRLSSVSGLRVLHVAGRIEAASVRERLGRTVDEPGEWYRIVEYVDDMGSALAAADLVVSRAGATSIAETTVVGRPAVLVPYPYATEDHQRLNAEAVEAAGGAVVVSDEELDAERFGDIVLGLLADPEERARMAKAAAGLGRPGAARSVADLIETAAGSSDVARPSGPES
jgi:UDP-N-acetylglucosamine--N-acetylmuramyl-(pentapeptide) pyrophosphoryl-undecaprenol N-acetylglucosamine transferase